ncbi:MAG: hypothetical protein AAF991_12335, partial [Pseudomonadota bacterium]
LLPHNPDIVFASAWKAERKPWTIISGGTAKESGFYKSDDAGVSWRKITKGLPEAPVGKLDIAVSAADSSVVYLLVEAPGDQGGVYRSDDQGESFRQVSSKKGLRTRPFYYTNIEADPNNADRVYVMATRYYRSEDGGESWEERDSPHGDNHDMWINPNNSQLFIQGNDGGANVTHNGGETWSSQFNQPTTELYQVEVDDQYPYWLYGGQQDNSSTIAVPSRAPYRVQSRESWLIETGGCETGPAVPKPGDHNVVYANCKGRFGVFDKRTGREQSYYVGAANMYGQNPRDLRYRFQRVSPIHVSPHDSTVVYHASQFVHRTQDEGKSWEQLSPDLTAFEDDKQVISGAPITRDITGEEFYSTIYSLRESPVVAGVIWVGANDGPVHVTRDGGESWKDVTPRGLASGGRVDSVEPSPHDPAKAYISVLRYQLGDPRPYVYRTTNYGRSWVSLANGKNGIAINEPVRVVREDPVRAGLLFAGTDRGVYVSFDDGQRWHPLRSNLPVAQVSDLKVFRDDLVLSTMGRGFWVLDKINALRDSAFWGGSSSDQAYLFEPASTVRYRQNLRTGDAPDDPDYPKPAVYVDYLIPEGTTETLTIEFFAASGERVNGYTLESSAPENGSEAPGPTVEEDMALSTVRFLETAELTAHPGMNRFAWDMRYPGAWHKDEDRRFSNGPLVLPGQYLVRMTLGEREFERSLELQVDPRLEQLGVGSDDMREQLTLQRQVLEALDGARRLAAALEESPKKGAEGEADATDQELKEAALAILNTEEGTYMPPGLIAQLAYLYSMISTADQKLGQDAFERFGELNEQLLQVRSTIES